MTFVPQKLTPEQIVAELWDVYLGAKEAGAWAPALRALELIGRYLGMWEAQSRGTTDLLQLVLDDPLGRYSRARDETDRR